MARTMQFRCEIDLPFEDASHATICRKALEVDSELRPERVQKTYKVIDNVLHVEIHAVDKRSLRVGISSFCDMARVTIDTLREFAATEELSNPNGPHMGS